MARPAARDADQNAYALHWTESERSFRMKWSWRLGRLFGIDVSVHATFLILLAWVGMSHYQREGSIHGALVGVAFILAVFGTVVLHEFGHALTARRFGIKTKDITLYPIGG